MINWCCMDVDIVTHLCKHCSCSCHCVRWMCVVLHHKGIKWSLLTSVFAILLFLNEKWWARSRHKNSLYISCLHQYQPAWTQWILTNKTLNLIFSMRFLIYRVVQGLHGTERWSFSTDKSISSIYALHYCESHNTLHFIVLQFIAKSTSQFLHALTWNDTWCASLLLCN